MINHFDKRAQGFDQLPWFSDRIFNNWIINHIQGFGDSICDIGAGTGIMCRKYCEVFHSVVAIEPNLQMFNLLEGKLSSLPNCTMFNCAIENLSLKDKSVDISISKSSLHHFLNIPNAIKEMARVSSKAICLIEVISPSEICLPFARVVLVKKEISRKKEDVFTADLLKNYLAPFSKDVRSLIFDQYIDVTRWLENSDLSEKETGEIKEFILSQNDEVKHAMHIHLDRENIRMLRRMNLVIGIL